RVLKVPVKVPLSCLVKVPSVIAIVVSFSWVEVRRTVPAWLALGDRIGRCSHRERASGRNASGGPREAKKFGAATPRSRGRPAYRPGKFFRRTGCGQWPRASALLRAGR